MSKLSDFVGIKQSLMTLLDIFLKLSDLFEIFTSKETNFKSSEITIIRTSAHILI